MEKPVYPLTFRTLPASPFRPPCALRTLRLLSLPLCLNYVLGAGGLWPLAFNTLLLLLSLWLLGEQLKGELRLRRSLKAVRPSLSLTKFAKEQALQSDRVFLGYGYRFTPRHTRALDEARKLGLLPETSGEATTEGRMAAHGSPLLQYLEPKQQRLYLDCRDLNGHTMVFGTTGAGKTSLFSLLCTQAVLREETVIVLDPKHDRHLEQRLFEICERVRPGFFRSFCPHGKQSCAFDILAGCDTPNQISTRLTSQLQEGGSASSFKAYAHEALSIACKALILNHHKVTPQALLKLTGNVEALRRELVCFLKQRSASPGQEKMQDYFKRVFSKSFPKAETLRGMLQWCEAQGCFKISPPEAEYLGDLVNVCYQDSNYYAKITQGILPYLSMLSGGRLGELLSSTHSEVFSFREVINHALVFYVALDTLADPILGQTLGRLMLSSLTAEAARAYGRGKAERRVSVFIDEASEVVSEELIQLLNKARGAGFALTIATQTLADFEARGGSSALSSQILGNCNNLIALRLNDQHSARAVCSRLPQTTLLRRASSMSVSDAGGLVDGMRDTVSRSVSEELSPLFPAEVLGLLPDLEFVAALADGRCLKGYVPYLQGDSEPLPGRDNQGMPGAAREQEIWTGREEEQTQA